MDRKWLQGNHLRNSTTRSDGAEKWICADQRDDVGDGSHDSRGLEHLEFMAVALADQTGIGFG